MRLYFTLGLLVLAPLSLKNVAAAPSSEGRVSTIKAHKRFVHATVSAKRKTVTHSKHQRLSLKTASRKSARIKTAAIAKHSIKPKRASIEKKKKTHLLKSHPLRTARVKRQNQKLALHKVNKPIRMSAAHRNRYMKARQTAIAKLMKQIGKPYVWGGTSPKTGFDCSGLVYYAYKDLVKFKIPRTANAMYHSKNAKPVNRAALQRGDLVFFKINRGHLADHVGVYLGNGKFIQSPSTGKSIKITALSEGYWQRHYLGARRMMTPLNIR